MPPSPSSCRISYRPPSRSPICSTAALPYPAELRLDDGPVERRDEPASTMVASTSTSVFLELNCGPGLTSMIVASGSLWEDAASTSLAWSAGGMGTLLVELSPTNGVFTPGDAGLPVAEFSSDGGLESSMLRCRNRPGAFDDADTPRVRLKRPSVASFSVQEVYTIVGRADPGGHNSPSVFCHPDDTQHR